MKKRIFVLSLCLLLLVSMILPSVASRFSEAPSSDSSLTKEEIKDLVRAHRAHEDTCKDSATCPYLTAYRQSLVYPHHEPQKAETRTDAAAYASKPLPLPDFVPVPTTAEEAKALDMEHGEYHEGSCPTPDTCPYVIAYKQYLYPEPAHRRASTLTAEEIKALMRAHAAHKDTCTGSATCPYITAYLQSLVYPHHEPQKAETRTDAIAPAVEPLPLPDFVPVPTTAEEANALQIEHSECHEGSCPTPDTCPYVIAYKQYLHPEHTHTPASTLTKEEIKNLVRAHRVHEDTCKDSATCPYLTAYRESLVDSHTESRKYVADDFACSTTHCDCRRQKDKAAQPYSEECSFKEYCDPAVDGQHLRYEVCTLCGNFGEFAYDYCRGTDGGFCWYCVYGESWS